MLVCTTVGTSCFLQYTVARSSALRRALGASYPMLGRQGSGLAVFVVRPTPLGFLRVTTQLVMGAPSP